MKVLLLAAGYATRLYPLTLNTPKPLLSVAGRTVLEFIFDLIEPVKEVDEVFIVTNKKFYGNFRDWKKTFKSSKKITVLDDGSSSNETRLGATGDIEFVIEKENVKDDLLVLAGDNLFRADLSKFIDFSVSGRPYVTLGLYDIKELLLASRYGIVSVDKNNKVVDFKEKPANPRSTLAAMCLYFFPKERLGIMKQYLGLDNSKDAPGYFLEWLYKKEDVFGYVFKDNLWFDTGDKKSLEEADKEFRKEIQ
ncbi:MAG: nucleotidyltransferase family protein [Candidatus Omnitrophota bacterium]|nr:nucleotidyltransferase family protein [Candidatus Omnitrophota bacterium]